MHVPERRPFLKRGEGRLGMTSLPTSTVKEVLHASADKPAVSRKTHPVKRSLSLERPVSARRYVPTRYSTAVGMFPQMLTVLQPKRST